MTKMADSKIKQYLWIAFLVFLIFVGFYFGRQNCALWNEKDCTGFLGKTIWEGLDLVVIPATIAGVATYLDWVGRKADRENTKDNQREVALQSYFDSMTNLILEKGLKKSKLGDEIREIAQVKTISTLERLDTERKSKLIDFLCELDVVKGSDEEYPIISFKETDLRGVYLQNSNLSGAHLHYALLEDSHLEGSYLNETHLDGTFLQEAHLDGAFLVSTYLPNAHLEGATFRYAHLNGAKLYNANLKGAILYKAELEGAVFNEAIMPDGKKYNPDVLTIEILTS